LKDILIIIDNKAIDILFKVQQQGWPDVAFPPTTILGRC